VVAAVGTTLAESSAFAPDAGPEADEERHRQFVALLGRYPAIAAAFVGYEDARFLYAGRPETFSIALRLEFDAPDGPSIIVRRVEGEGAARRETWWFELPDGSRTPARTRPLDFDPRTRPWYIDALSARAPVLTEPYSFAQANVVGVRRHSPAARRRHRLRLHARHAVAPDRRLQAHAQFDHHDRQ
jgi:hypothetical protein